MGIISVRYGMTHRLGERESERVELESRIQEGDVSFIDFEETTDKD